MCPPSAQAQPLLSNVCVSLHTEYFVCFFFLIASVQGFAPNGHRLIIATISRWHIKRQALTYILVFIPHSNTLRKSLLFSLYYR